MTLHLTCAFEVIKLNNERVITLFHHFFLQLLHIIEIEQKLVFLEGGGGGGVS